MADNTKIEWTDATWNPVNGCSLASPGCTNCYAMKQAHRVPQRRGLTQHTSGGMVWTGEVRFDEAKLTQPLHWKRPRRIFVCAHGDLFHDAVPDEWIDRVFAVMALCPQHTFQVLTKRSARMRAYLNSFGTGGTAHRVGGIMQELALDNGKSAFEACLNASAWPLPNVWLGVSVEDQRRAHQRIPDLLATPAAVRWLSCEPLLGQVDLTRIMDADAEECFHSEGRLTFKGRTLTESRSSLNALTGHFWGEDLIDGRWEGWGGEHEQASPGIGQPGYYRPLDWVVAGGESGPGARPMHPRWARDLRDQCQAAEVPFFFKQWGEHTAHPAPQARWADGSPVPAELEPVTFERIGKSAAGRLLDGTEHNAMPKGAA